MVQPSRWVVPWRWCAWCTVRVVGVAFPLHERASVYLAHGIIARGPQKQTILILGLSCI
jgi:hypothetical protein